MKHFIKNKEIYHDDSWISCYKKYHAIHNYIVDIISITEDCFILEYIDGNNTQDLLMSNNFTLTDSKRLCSFIKKAIFDMFESNILLGKFFVHNDLALSNIMLTSNGSFVIVDTNSFELVSDIGIFNAFKLCLVILEKIDASDDLESIKKLLLEYDQMVVKIKQYCVYEEEDKIKVVCFFNKEIQKYYTI